MDDYNRMTNEETSLLLQHENSLRYRSSLLLNPILPQMTYPHFFNTHLNIIFVLYDWAFQVVFFLVCSCKPLYEFLIWLMNAVLPSHVVPRYSVTLIKDSFSGQQIMEHITMHLSQNACWCFISLRSKCSPQLPLLEKNL